MRLPIESYAVRAQVGRYFRRVFIDSAVWLFNKRGNFRRGAIEDDILDNILRSSMVFGKSGWILTMISEILEQLSTVCHFSLEFGGVVSRSRKEQSDPHREAVFPLSKRQKSLAEMPGGKRISTVA
ncbi:hypothetical protein WN51_03942 [Melipona quadrifasciata]|uniref:Uncharacterized protein n=1 Tax=Melipona quadrifasciata TaxID=166423 RepID=A0A0M8ZRF5_9HYME|nr:hypothetical protein WN51_03942 [Melipona quadrifasciata]